jgi:quercetin dioxygenase-like cupin family protein
MKRTSFFAVFIVLSVVSHPSAWGQQGFKATPVLNASTTIGGQKLAFPQTDKPAIASLLVEIAPGGETGRHMHPVPTYVHVLEGTVTVEMEDKSIHEFQAGTAFLEVLNTWHNGKNLGKAPLKFLVVFATEEGKVNLVRPEKKE